MGQVLVFGSINTDLVTYVDILPGPGETVTGGRFQTFPGGKGANQAVAAARTGATVEMYGCVSDDAIGRESLASLVDAGVSTKNVVVRPGAQSGIAQVIVDSRGENLIAVAPGANFLFSPADVTFPHYTDGETVVSLFQNEIPQPTTEVLVQECKKRHMLVIWNMAPACRKRPPAEMLRAVDYLVCNQPELTSLAGDGETETLADRVRQWGVGSVVVTLGEQGALLVTGQETYHQAAFSVDVVDTVGTGDCFCGVFASSLSSGMPVKAAIRRAAAAAALSATVRGAQTSVPAAAEVDRFLSAAGKTPRS